MFPATFGRGNNKLRGEALALRYYECMFLIDSGRYAQDPSGTEEAIKSLLSRYDAEVVGMTPWQEGRLAYEIEGQRKGLHFLAFFKMDGSHVTEFNRACKLSDLVIRQMLLEHKPRLFELLIQQVGSHELERSGDDEDEAPAASSKEPVEAGAAED